MAEELAAFGGDLVNRWTPALDPIAGEPRSAARHFCTSAREVIISMLHLSAPDATVKAAVHDCEMTERNVPTRRAKIAYLTPSPRS